MVRDDVLPEAATYRSPLYHIYENDDVKDDLNRRCKPEDPLPSLLIQAYTLLGYDWRETYRLWSARPDGVPPVMITVANRTETAARIKWTFDRGKVSIDELCDPERMLHIDSRVLREAEETEEPIAEVGAAADARKLTRKQRAERLRRQVDTVGRPGMPGMGIRNVISVGMLSEGWDAKTVTHIMGLRAFHS